jgi:hypothetical protein
MSGYAIASYLYAFFMWYVFYLVPMKHGVVSRQNLEGLNMIGDISLDLRDEENLKTVVRELEHDRRFSKFQQNKAMMNRKNSENSSTFN